MQESVLIAAIATIGLVLIATQAARLLKTGMQQRTLREAIGRDDASVPALLAALERPSRPGRWTDSRIAFVLIALGVALILAVAMQGNLADLRDVGGLALFPILVGAALLLHRRLHRGPDDVA